MDTKIGEIAKSKTQWTISSKPCIQRLSSLALYTQDERQWYCRDLQYHPTTIQHIMFISHRSFMKQHRTSHIEYCNTVLLAETRFLCNWRVYPWFQQRETWQRWKRQRVFRAGSPSTTQTRIEMSLTNISCEAGNGIYLCKQTSITSNIEMVGSP